MNLNDTRNHTFAINDTRATIPAGSQTGRFVVAMIVYPIIILLSIIGNIIVVAAILRVQRLRLHPTNFILMSLAIADLLVTTTVMIPGFVTEILRGKWIFGMIFCKIWLGNDITFCTASILHLAAVSFDRYMAIENPLKYKQKMTKRTILIIIGCIWLISVLMSYPPIFLKLYSGFEESETDPDVCRMRPAKNYSVVSSLLSFYIPLIIILVLYGRIFVIARRHSNELQKLQNIIRRLHSDQKFVLENTKWKKNIKAIRTLGIVVGVFVVCWLPFFIMYLIMAHCRNNCEHPNLEVCITLIGYVNSFCNPIIYAFSNKEFRHAFAEILGYHNCRCFPFSSRLHTSMSKSVYSMNTKTTPPNHSRHTSVAPHSNSLQRNGYLSCTSSSLCPPMPRSRTDLVAAHENSEAIEMQTIVHERKTAEAFHELEQLVPNGCTGRASIVRMSSIMQDADDPASAASTPKQPRFGH